MKTNHKIIIYVCLVVAIITLIYLFIPNRNPVQEPKIKDNYNITLFLDLSDHLDTAIIDDKNFNMYRYQRFIEAAKILGECYVENLENAGKPLVRFDEKFQISTHPKGEFNIDTYLSNSIIELNKNNLQNYVKGNRHVIPTKMALNVERIYEQCRNKFIGKQWPGSDIYSFLSDKSNYYVEDKKNLMVIFTDGYPYYKDWYNFDSKYFLGDNPNWKTDLNNKMKNNNGLSEVRTLLNNNPKYGLEAATHELENLSVLIIGIRPDKKLNERLEIDLIKELWKSWFMKMGTSTDNIKVYHMGDCSTPTLQSAFNWLLKSQ